MTFELNHKLAARRPSLPTTANIDPVTASIIRGALETACFESAAFLGRAASSPVINQSNERNASILDAYGRLAAVSIGTPQLTYTSQLIARYGPSLNDTPAGGWRASLTKRRGCSSAARRTTCSRPAADGRSC